MKPAFWISRTLRPSVSSLFKAARLVLEATLLQQLQQRVLGGGGLLASLLGDLEVEQREVLAPEEPHEVVGADEQAAVESLHRFGPSTGRRTDTHHHAFSH